MVQTISIKKASVKYGVPISTMQDWVRDGRVQAKPTISRYMNRQIDIIETSLVQTIAEWRRTLLNSRAEILERLRAVDPETVVNLKQAEELSGIDDKTIRKYGMAGVLKFTLGELNKWKKPTWRIRVGDLICFVELYKQLIAGGKSDTTL